MIELHTGNTILESDMPPEQQDLQGRFEFVRDRLDNLPENFDGREVWSHYLTPIANQGSCASSWAWAVAQMLSDRISLRSLGSLNPILSPKSLLVCSKIAHTEDAVCVPSTLLHAVIHSYIEGLKEEQCLGDSQ